MNDIVTLAIPPATLSRLLRYVDAQQDARGAAEIASLAIDEWLNHAQNAPKPATRRHGYQWKTLFLPEGTQLRAWAREGFAYAEVVGDAIEYLGQSVSPHQFICSCKGISRSAWAEIAILFADANAWKSAAACRKEMARRPQPAMSATPSSTPSVAVKPALPAAPSPEPGSTRLPRIAPIPTQAQLQPAASGAKPVENVLTAGQDRRRSHRRAVDLLLD